MKLLIDDSLATCSVAEPIRQGWIEPRADLELRAGLTAASVDAQTVALVPSAEVAHLQATHLVDPGLAVLFTSAGPFAMRSPVRPDEIEHPTVRLYETSGTAEILARAVLEPFYGIRAATYSADAADATVVVTEGVEAVRPIEGGFSEDLARAWFILTGQPLVSHVLVVPKNGDEIELVERARAIFAIGHERRREVRTLISERDGVPRERLNEIFSSARFKLEEDDLRALLMFLQRGNKGSAYPYVWELGYVED